MKEKVKEVIEEIRPYVQADGGDIELIDVDEEKGIVKVRLTGMCAGCPFAQITLKQGIENEIKKKVPEVKEVVSV